MRFKSNLGSRLGVVRVMSVPPGASVWAGGRFVGVTSRVLQLRVPPGLVKVTFRKPGYRRTVKYVRVRSGGVHRVLAILPRRY